MSSPKTSHPWVNYETKKLIRKRDHKFKKWRKNGDKALRLREEYLKLKNTVQRRLRRQHWKHLDSLFTNENTSIDSETTKPRALNKKFWGYIKSKKTESTGISPLKERGKLVTDPKEKAELLNKQFESAFSAREDLTEDAHH